MSQIFISNLKHFQRDEEQEILNYITEHNDSGHVSIFGLSGTGKTEIATSIIKLLHSGDLFSSYTILHYDASQITDDCSSELFFNVLIYKLLQKSISNDRNQTHVAEGNTFLEFLDKKSYKDEIKNNAKQTLIASLSLLPTVGPIIYKILNTDGNSLAKNYHTNRYLFREYLEYLCETTGLLIFIDNIQYLPTEVVDDFYELVRQLEESIFLFTSYTLETDASLSKKLVENYSLNDGAFGVRVDNVPIDAFDEICKQNLNSQQYYNVKEHLKYYFGIVQFGNMREIGEFIFQINVNGLETITDTPTVLGIKSLDEINKDIIALASLFPEGIKMSFIERVIKLNHGCSETQISQSISDLKRMSYVLIGENNTLKIEHEKIATASRQNLELANEEKRFTELICSCKRIFADIAYESVDDSDFVFCVNGLMEFERQFDFLKHLGMLEKYINILYSNFRFFQICQLYRNLSKNIANGEKIVLMFPICSIIQILDSFQKTSCFAEGLEISNHLSAYYNMELYRAKFLLQSYNYQEALDVLTNRLNNYESWSIYLNALQHLRRDDEVKNHVENLLDNTCQFSDTEYYYIILRNSGHLFTFDKAYDNLQQALKYFQNLNNSFVESTCLNNIGILFLYQNQSIENVYTARKYFKQARKIMSQLKSNEEYQSIINIGVTYICENNPHLALEYFECARGIMPTTLSFDMIKLECNILMCKYLIDKSDIQSLRADLLKLCSDAEDLPDPWIKLLCVYNLYVLRHGKTPDTKELGDLYPGDMSRYGLILNNLKLEKLMVGISPHWRY